MGFGTIRPGIFGEKRKFAISEKALAKRAIPSKKLTAQRKKERWDAVEEQILQFYNQKKDWSFLGPEHRGSFSAIARGLSREGIVRMNDTTIMRILNGMQKRRLLQLPPKSIAGGPRRKKKIG